MIIIISVPRFIIHMVRMGHVCQTYGQKKGARWTSLRAVSMVHSWYMRQISCCVFGFTQIRLLQCNYGFCSVHQPHVLLELNVQPASRWKGIFCIHPRASVFIDTMWGALECILTSGRRTSCTQCTLDGSCQSMFRHIPQNTLWLALH